MAFVTMKEVLDKAYAGKYGIPALCACDEITVRSAIEAAEETNSPLILIGGEIGFKNLISLGSLVIELANEASVPVAFCLDHSPSLEHTMMGIRAGYSAVMVDRSALPYEQNVAQVQEIVKIAHGIGISVEAELGHVGQGDNYEVDGSSNLTDPAQAKKFIDETGVDCLAVAIGSAHGAYKGVPKLRFELLSEIDKACGIPLVLHGGSGTGDDNIHRACELGICKVNIANDIFRVAVEAIKENDLSGNKAYGFIPTIVNAMKKLDKHLFDVCGCTGKAWKAEKNFVPFINASSNVGEMKKRM